LWQATKAAKDDSLAPIGRYEFAMYKAGKGLEAYGKAPKPEESFPYLANLFVSDKDGAGLQALLAAHRAHKKDEASLLYFEARAKVWQKKTAEAIPLIQEACRKQPNVNERRNWLTQWIIDMDEIGAGLKGYRAAPDKQAALQTLGNR